MFGFGHHGQSPPAHPPAGAPRSGCVHQPTFKIICKAYEGYCLTVRDGTVTLVPANPRDEHQHWYKNMRFSTQIKEEEGNPAFLLVNKATGLAIKHSLGQSNPLKLAPFNLEYLDESVMWSESGDVGDGFSCIRMVCVNNIRLNFGAFHGDKDHDGTIVVLVEWANGDNQSWKILPWDDDHALALQPPAAAVQRGRLRLSTYQLMQFAAAVIVGAAAAPVPPPWLLAAFVVWIVAVVT